MNTIHIETTYNYYHTAQVTLPEGKTWNDVMDWYIKWDTLHARFYGDEDYTEYFLWSRADVESTDWKRPNSISIYASKEDGSIDFDKELESKE